MFVQLTINILSYKYNILFISQSDKIAHSKLKWTDYRNFSKANNYKADTPGFTQGILTQQTGVI